MGCWVILLVCANPFQEVPRPTFLKETHEWRSERLAGVRRYFGNGCLGTLALLDIAACNLLELEILCHVGGDEDIGELAVGHEKLGNEVDVPVVDAPVLLPWLPSGLSVPLEEL